MQIVIKDLKHNQETTMPYKGEIDYLTILYKLRACREYNLIDTVGLDENGNFLHKSYLTNTTPQKADYYILTRVI